MTGESRRGGLRHTGWSRGLSAASTSLPSTRRPLRCGPVVGSLTALGRGLLVGSATSRSPNPISWAVVNHGGTTQLVRLTPRPTAPAARTATRTRRRPARRAHSPPRAPGRARRRARRAAGSLAASAIRGRASCRGAGSPRSVRCTSAGTRCPHAGRVGPERRVDEVSELRELDDPVEPALHLPPGAAEDGPVQEDVLSSRQLHVEARPELEERGDPAADGHLALLRPEHTGDHLHERRLARPVATDDPDGLASSHAEVHVRERQEIVVDDAAPQPLDRELLERRDPLPRQPVVDADVAELDDERVVGHGVRRSTPPGRCSARRSPSR